MKMNWINAAAAAAIIISASAAFADNSVIKLDASSRKWWQDTSEAWADKLVKLEYVPIAFGRTNCLAAVYTNSLNDWNWGGIIKHDWFFVTEDWAALGVTGIMVDVYFDEPSTSTNSSGVVASNFTSRVWMRNIAGRKGGWQNRESFSPARVFDIQTWNTMQYTWTTNGFIDMSDTVFSNGYVNHLRIAWDDIGSYAAVTTFIDNIKLLTLDGIKNYEDMSEYIEPEARGDWVNWLPEDGGNKININFDGGDSRYYLAWEQTNSGADNAELVLNIPGDDWSEAIKLQVEVKCSSTDALIALGFGSRDFTNGWHWISTLPGSSGGEIKKVTEAGVWETFDWFLPVDSSFNWTNVVDVHLMIIDDKADWGIDAPNGIIYFDNVGYIVPESVSIYYLSFIICFLLFFKL